jgi:hypothetical protein
MHWRFYLKVILVNCAVIVLLLTSAELSLRYFYPQSTQKIYSNQLPLITPDPELHHVLTPNAHVVIRNYEFNPDYEIEYKINGHGLRDAKVYNDEKQPGTIRILVLGDSFAYGEGNNYAKTWPVILENNLQRLGYRVEIIKAGVFGYDTTKELQFLKRLYPKYKPDLILLTFLINDLFTNQLLTGKAARFGRLAKRSELNPTSVASLFEEASRMHLLTAIKKMVLANDRVYTRLY